MDQARVLVHTGVDSPLRGSLRLNAEIPLVALFRLVHLRIPLPFLVLWPPAHSGCALVEVELGAAMRVASTIVPCRIVMLPRSLRWALTVSKTCSPRPCFSSRWRKVKIVVSSGIRSLISSMPAKRRMVGTSIRASSIAGSLSEYHCCSRWIRSNCCAEACGYVARGYGGRPPFLLALG